MQQQGSANAGLEKRVWRVARQRNANHDVLAQAGLQTSQRKPPGHTKSANLWETYVGRHRLIHGTPPDVLLRGLLLDDALV